MTTFNQWEYDLINITRQQNLILAEANNLDMTTSIKPSTKEKWFLLLTCLGINVYLTPQMDDIDFDVFLYSTLFALSILILTIYLSLKDFANRLKFNFGILMLILINIILTSLNVFISFITYIFLTADYNHYGFL